MCSVCWFTPQMPRQLEPGKAGSACRPRPSADWCHVPCLGLWQATCRVTYSYLFSSSPIHHSVMFNLSFSLPIEFVIFFFMQILLSLFRPAGWFLQGLHSPTWPSPSLGFVACSLQDFFFCQIFGPAEFGFCLTWGLISYFLFVLFFYLFVLFFALIDEFILLGT